MRVRIIAIGSRMPGWVREGVDEYLKRFGSAFRVSLVEIDAGPRTGGAARRAIEVEGQRLLAALRKDEYVVALDEHGTEMTTAALASWLDARMRDGRDLALLIGGPDGLAPEVLARSNFKWALSKLTFPHALVRVVLAEQLYRAHSMLSNHPYHRE
ncbi:MAG: 23S rRNA (pseudouridine(1915)-N(3))-methyltransferase RlmH [Steroidobacteraceae bacterium]|nr:23S rRNA (pseudouridine(1915)-N(3))-methyltransferase RlmH [Steroidobacteraceae bacterium]